MNQISINPYYNNTNEEQISNQVNLFNFLPKYVPEYDKDLHNKVIDILKNNPELVQTLIELAIFERTRHDHERPCNDDCYSGDMKNFFKMIGEILPIKQ